MARQNLNYGKLAGRIKARARKCAVSWRRIPTTLE